MRDLQKNIITYILIGTGIAASLILGVQYGQQRALQQSIAEKVLRFHVLANSDTAEDQELKLKVRDAVGTRMAEALACAKSKKESEAIVRGQMPEIKRTAETVIAEEGYTYEVDTFLREVEFPAKSYGAYTFPAGSYEALEVVIGAGEGHNWWCVMYPNMCFSGTVYEVVDEDAKGALREVLGEEEYRRVLASGDYEIQFKYLTFLNELTE